MSRYNKNFRQHEGELLVQNRRQVPEQLTESLQSILHSDLPAPKAEFLRQLQYFPIGAMDSNGNLWATVLCNPVTTILSEASLSIVSKVPHGDPFVSSVLPDISGPKYFAGVGIDFTIRRRYKIGGIIESAKLSPDGVLTLILVTNENMGNCPKYITIRNLRPTIRQPEAISLGAKLNEEACAVIRQASTVFIATKHIVNKLDESDLGFNHRGGPPGFVRYFEDQRGTHLVLPDYSGNRFYQSLGNIQTDNSVGVAIPDFSTGHLLHIYGEAHNIFDDEAEALLPGSTLLTFITVRDCVLVRHSMNLELIGKEDFSPYNPKLRLLAVEKNDVAQTVELTAVLTEVLRDSQNISTFVFELPNAVEIIPGGHAIFDFSNYAPKNYQHMNDMNPRSLNDDYVRTWTVSRVSEDFKRISVTVKKAGVVSSLLHSIDMTTDKPLEVTLKGFGGNFSCFQGNELRSPKMVWIAGGVGITPFLAMYRSLIKRGEQNFDIELLYSCRGDEVALVKEMTTSRIRVQVFDSTVKEENNRLVPYKLFARRVQEFDLNEIHDLGNRTAFVCGPPTFMTDVRQWLQTRLDPNHILYENFDF